MTSDASSRNAANKRKGSKAETDALKRIREHGITAERLRLVGKADEGDLVAIVTGTKHVVIEVKATRALEVTRFIREAQVERDNYCKARGLSPAQVEWRVLFKRRGCGDPREWASIRVFGDELDDWSRGTP